MSSTKTSRPRSTRALIALLFTCVLGLTTTACQDPTGIVPPQLVQAYNEATGSSLTTEQATQSCAEINAKAGPTGCQQIVANVLASKKTGPRPYKYFAKCTEAVNYLFAGSKWLGWAHHQVLRETGNTDKTDMISKSGTYWGCTQLNPEHRKHLRGPWNDAYYSVLRMWESLMQTNGASRSQWT